MRGGGGAAQEQNGSARLPKLCDSGIVTQPPVSVFSCAKRVHLGLGRHSKQLKHRQRRASRAVRAVQHACRSFAAALRRDTGVASPSVPVPARPVCADSASPAAFQPHLHFSLLLPCLQPLAEQQGARFEEPMTQMADLGRAVERGLRGPEPAVAVITRQAPSSQLSAPQLPGLAGNTELCRRQPRKDPFTFESEWGLEPLAFPLCQPTFQHRGKRSFPYGLLHAFLCPGKVLGGNQPPKHSPQIFSLEWSVSWDVFPTKPLI